MNFIILLIIIIIGSKLLLRVAKFAFDYSLFLIVKSLFKLIFFLIKKSIKLIFTGLLIIYDFLFRISLTIGYCMIHINYKTL
jgi:hypothetical protein